MLGANLLAGSPNGLTHAIVFCDRAHSFGSQPPIGARAFTKVHPDPVYLNALGRVAPSRIATMRLKVFIGTTSCALLATCALPAFAQADRPADNAPPSGASPGESPATPPSSQPA